MRFFGKNEAELKSIAGELDKLQTELDIRESALASAQANAEHEKKLLDDAKVRFESEKEAFREETKKEYECIESKNAEFESRRFELAKQEAAAKANFVEKQREAFKEVIDKRMKELDTRQQELANAEEQLAKRFKELHTSEAEIARRELAVTEREQKADAGFADKAKALAEEAARQHQANQAEAERLRKQADALLNYRQRLEVAKAGLVQRAQNIMAAEQKRDAGFADERAALDTELREKRVKAETENTNYRAGLLSAVEAEIASLKTKRLEEIAKAEQAERDRIRTGIAAEREVWAKQHHDARNRLDAERS
jgi:hypothetical protein